MANRTSRMIEITSVAVCAVLSLIGATSARAYDFDDGTLQGWTMQGIGDGNTATYHAPNPFSLGWDDRTQYPGDISVGPHGDPIGNNLGSLAASTGNLILPAGFPSGAWWFIDLVSPSLTANPQWQQMTGLSLKVRGEVGSHVQILLNVTRKSDGQDVWLRAEDYARALAARLGLVQFGADLHIT